MKDHPVLLARPAWSNKKDLLSKVIPIAMHGDGVQYMAVGRAGGKTLEVLSWGSLLAKGPTQMTNFLTYLVVKSVVKSFGFLKTWQRIWKVLLWSFKALAEGRWPSRDWNGLPFQDKESLDYQKQGELLAEGFSAVLFLLKADLEFLATHFLLEHPGSNTPCCLCQANRDMQSRPWTDCRKVAAWRSTNWTLETWPEHHPKKHPAFSVPHGIGIDMVFPDLMHCKHLGADQVLVGSVVSWLMEEFLRGSAKENVEYIWAYVKQWHKDTKSKEHPIPLCLIMWVCWVAS